MTSEPVSILKGSNKKGGWVDGFKLDLLRNADSYNSLAGDDVKVSRWFIDVRFKLLFHGFFSQREQAKVRL
jgi:hypothetical protein